MYHPVEDRLYALHMLQPESYDFNGPPFQTELRLARLHPETAEVEWFTPSAISMDGIQSGVCDLTRSTTASSPTRRRHEGSAQTARPCPPSPAPATASRLGPTSSTTTSPPHPRRWWARIPTAKRWSGTALPHSPLARAGQRRGVRRMDWHVGRSLHESDLDRGRLRHRPRTRTQAKAAKPWTSGARFHVVPPATDNHLELSSQPCPTNAAPFGVFDLGGRSLGTFSGTRGDNPRLRPIWACRAG